MWQWCSAFRETAYIWVLCLSISSPVLGLCNRTVLVKRIRELSATYVLEPPTAAYCSGLTIRITRQNFLFCVALSECCILTIMCLISSAFLCVSCGLLQAIPGVANQLLQGGLLPFHYMYEVCRRVRDLQYYSSVLVLSVIILFSTSSLGWS